MEAQEKPGNRKAHWLHLRFPAYSEVDVSKEYLG